MTTPLRPFARRAGPVLIAITLLGGSSFSAGAELRFGGELDAATFEACADARENEDSASKKQAKGAAKQFKGLDAKKARKAIANAFADAGSKKERRAAFNDAVEWCRAQDAYEKAGLTLPRTVEVVDTTTAAVAGTTTPGATVTDGTATATADAGGNFSISVSGLVPGENRVSLRAQAELHYPSRKSVTIVLTESEGAYKASAAGIPYGELVKDPDALIGRRIYSRAQVFQFDSITGPDGLLVAVTVQQPGEYEYWTDNVFLTLVDPALGSGIDNDDIIEFWGDVAGALDYETSLGGTNTVPSVLVKYMTLIEKRAE